MKYIINGFSTKMLRRKTDTKIKVETVFELDVELEKDECISAIGHHNIAEHLDVPRNRMSIMLEKGDIAYLVESRLINNQELYDYRRLTVI